MKNHIRNTNLLFRWLCVFAAIAGNVSAGQTDYLSPLTVVADPCEGRGKTLYIAEYTANKVAVFDIAGRKVKKTYSLPVPPSGLAISPNGSQLYVTGASPMGKIYVIDLSKKKIIYDINVGHTPTSPVISPDGKTLYVCNQFNNNISLINLQARKEIATIQVSREPVDAAITLDGKFLLVANLLPAGAADGDYTAAVVSIIDTASKKVVKDIKLLNGATDVRGICLSTDGKYAYATHILARYQLPTTQLERGWMNTNALSIIDIAKQKLFNTVLLDDVDLGAANPWAVACTTDGKYICITHASTHEISVIDRAALHRKLKKVAAGEKVSEISLSQEDVPNDLSFLVGLRRRLKLAGNGPRGLAIIGTKVYAAEYFTDSISEVDIDPEVEPKATMLPLGQKGPMSTVRRGEMLFNDASLCFQKWQSCASCHPGGARADALNWDLLNDGIGNPKNAKSLLLSHKTPPAMSTGVRDSGETAVRAGIKFIQFAVRPEADAVAIDEYLKSLKPVQSPYLIKKWPGNKPRLSKAAERGREIFEEAQCASCHSGSLYTDLKKYDVGTGKDSEKDSKFDTPTLVEVWRTSPYLYDGRAKTIKEVLTDYNSGDKHGFTSELTDKQISDLAEYILSL